MADTSLSRIALVSDLHGNVTAFHAVLTDLERRGIQRVINLGDVIGKGPRGRECIALTRRHCDVTVRGNWDAFISDPTSVLQEAGRWWRDELTEDDRQWLAALPNSHDLQLSGRRIRLVHASAISEHVRVHFHHSDDEFIGMFENTPFTGDGPVPTMVGYGDIHDAYLEVHEGRTLFNVGSVGNPLDEPTASYVIMEGIEEGDPTDPIGLQFVRVPYAIEEEIAAARACGMPEVDAYAVELRTAIYRGRHAELGLHPEDRPVSR